MGVVWVVNLRYPVAALLGVLTCLTSLLRADERGLPPLRVFTAREYESHYQVWQSTVAPDGRMMFGSFGSVLEYDGARWRRHLVPTSFVRALAFDTDGALYVSTDQVFGRLNEDAFGNRNFESLTDRLPPAFAPLTRARTLVGHPDGVFVGTHEGVIRWHNDTATTFEFGPGGNDLFRAGDTLLNMRRGRGIWRWNGSDWTQWTDAEPAKVDGFTALTASPDDAHVALLAATGHGLYLISEDGQLTRWTAAANAATEGAKFYNATRLSDGRIDLATVDRGLFIFSADGEVAQNLTPDEGLSHLTNIAVTEDRERGLWVSTINGITRVDLGAPFTVFDARTGFPDGINFTLLRHRGTFYATCDGALLRLEPASDGKSAHFVVDERAPRDLRLQGAVSHAGGLVIGGINGLYVLGNDDGWQRIVANDDVISSAHVSETDPDRIFYNLPFGPGSAYWDGQQWRDEGPIPGVSAESYSFREDRAGRLWYATVTGEVWLLTRPTPEASWQEAVVQKIGEAEGLPPPTGPIFVHLVQDEALFGTDRGPYRWNAQSSHMELTDRLVLPGQAEASPLVDGVATGAQGTYWSATGTDRIKPEVGLARWVPEGDRLVAAPAPTAVRDALGISGAQNLVSELTADGREVVWVKGIDSLLRVEVDRLDQAPSPWAPIITAVSAAGETRPISPPTGASADATPPTFPFSTAPITVRFVAPRFGNSTPAQFRTRLAGYQSDWTPPSTDTVVSYTNLSGGPFELQVQALDPDGNAVFNQRHAFVTVTELNPFFQNKVVHVLLLASVPK